MGLWHQQVAVHQAKDHNAVEDGQQAVDPDEGHQVVGVFDHQEAAPGGDATDDAENFQNRKLMSVNM